MWLIKQEEETDPSFGKRPRERSVQELINSSVVVIDKHKGPTSHRITAWVRQILRAKKAGHAGTLDPAVTGVLPIALGDATKAMPVLTSLDKEYVGIMRLHKSIEEEMLMETIAQRFIGRIRQLPPKRAAVARKPRIREIYFFDVLEISERDVLFRMGCEAGTYVRKVVHDLGQTLGIGAHLIELRRTRFGHFHESQAHPLLELRDAYEFWQTEGDEKQLREILIPLEHAMPHVKKVFVKDSAIYNITCGAPVYTPGICRIQKGIRKGDLVAVCSLKEELVALGIARMSSEEMLEKEQGSAIRTDRVFMPKGIYPKA